jgi:hypothetical protein
MIRVAESEQAGLTIVTLQGQFLSVPRGQFFDPAPGASGEGTLPKFAGTRG